VVAAGNEDVLVVSHDWGITWEERHVFPGRDYVGEPYRDTSHHWLSIECVRCPLTPHPLFMFVSAPPTLVPTGIPAGRARLHDSRRIRRRCSRKRTCGAERRVRVCDGYAAWWTS